MKLLHALAGALALALASPAFADNVTLPASGGATFTAKTTTTSGVDLPWHTLSDSTQVNAFGTSGSPAVPMLGVQGRSGMTPLIVNQAGTFLVNGVGGVFPITYPANGTGPLGSPSGGAAAAQALLGGCLYNTSLPALTNGQMASCQFDSSAQLLVNVKSATGLAQGSTSSGQTGSLILAATGTNAPTQTNGQSNALSLTTTGELRTTLESATVSKSPGTAASKAIQIAGIFNNAAPTLSDTQSASLQLDAAGQLKIATPVGLAQGSTTSGQTGSLVEAAVTTSAPSYTTAQTSPLSLNTSGGLRLDTVTQGVGATSAAAPANAQAMGARAGANLVAVSQTSATAIIAATSGTTTQLIALSSGQVIHVTAVSLLSDGTGRIKFVYGTGSSCGTGTTDLSGNYRLKDGYGVAYGSGLGPIMIVPAGNALCITTTASVNIDGTVSYTQFQP